MRLTSSGTYTRSIPVPKMPPGLVELMEGLTRNVLKNNPTNVYEFCANHVEKLLEIRDGPSSKKQLTLEQKIAKAQEKVRKRALERRQHFDGGIQGDIKREPKKDDSGDEDHSHEKPPMSNRRAPVHHDQNLSLASEVEISHEAFIDNSLTPRDPNVDEQDDTGVSKSSTVSSISKITVIDLGDDDDKEETIATTETDKAKDNNIVENFKESITNDHADNENLTDMIESLDIQGNVESLIKYDNSPENVKDVNIVNDDLTGKVNYESTLNIESIAFPIIPITDDVSPQYVKEVIIVNDDHAGKVVRESVDFFEELKNFGNGGEYNAALRSPDVVNTIIEEDEKDMADINVQGHVSVAENNIQDIEAVMLNDHDNIVLETDSNFTNITPNEASLTENIHNDYIPTDTNKLVQETAQPNPENDKTVVADNSDSKITIENHVQNCDVNDTFAVESLSLENNDERNQIEDFSEQKSCATVHIIIEATTPTPDAIENNVIKNEIENSDVPDVIIKEYIDGTHDNNKDKTEHKCIEEKLHDVCEETNEHEDSLDYINTTSQQGPGSTDNNDDSSIIESDISKLDEDLLSRDDSQNGHNSMDLETAAVTIQKVFRSFLFKSRNSTFEDISNDDRTSLDEDSDKKEEYFAVASLNKERRPLGITRMDTVLQTVNEEKSLSLSTDDSSTLSSAATTIQAHVRGFLVRNRLNSYKTVSTNSLVNSNEMLDTDPDQQKNKTILNIHIVPEEGNYLSRDESLLTSMDLSLDGSPPSSINLHPLSYDISERRKLLKREDAIQSISPPSNNSGKLSEDSVKEVLIENDVAKTESKIIENIDRPAENPTETASPAVTNVTIRDTLSDQDGTETVTERRKRSMIRTSSDESDVITPYTASPRSLVGDFDNPSKLLHSGEFHDVVLPTKVSRSDTAVVREFKNVVAYILLWNNSL